MWTGKIKPSPSVSIYEQNYYLIRYSFPSCVIRYETDVWMFYLYNSHGTYFWHLQQFSAMALALCNLYQIHHLSMGIWQLGSGIPPTASGNLCPHLGTIICHNTYPLCHTVIITENEWLGMSPMAVRCIWTLNIRSLFKILSAIVNKLRTIHKMLCDGGFSLVKWSFSVFFAGNGTTFGTNNLVAGDLRRHNLMRPDGIKPLPEQIRIYHRWGPVTLKWVLKNHLSKFHSNISRANDLTLACRHCDEQQWKG